MYPIALDPQLFWSAISLRYHLIFLDTFPLSSAEASLCFLFRLRAVTLFSVVRRAKRETWRPRFALLAASPLAQACTPLTKPEEEKRLLAVYFVLWGDREERKRERLGHDGKGKERRGWRSRLFPLPIVLSELFFDYRYFHWDTQRQPPRRREILSHLRPKGLQEARSQSFSLRKWKWGNGKILGWGGGEQGFLLLSLFLITFVRCY